MPLVLAGYRKQLGLMLVTAKEPQVRDIMMDSVFRQSMNDMRSACFKALYLRYKAIVDPPSTKLASGVDKYFTISIDEVKELLDSIEIQ